MDLLRQEIGGICPLVRTLNPTVEAACRMLDYTSNSSADIATLNRYIRPLLTCIRFALAVVTNPPPPTPMSIGDEAQSLVVRRVCADDTLEQESIRSIAQATSQYPVTPEQSNVMNSAHRRMVQLASDQSGVAHAFTVTFPVQTRTAIVIALAAGSPAGIEALLQKNTEDLDHAKISLPWDHDGDMRAQSILAAAPIGSPWYRALLENCGFSQLQDHTGDVKMVEDFFQRGEQVEHADIMVYQTKHSRD